MQKLKIPINQAMLALFCICLFVFAYAPLGDLKIYNAGSQLYWQGDNPYSIDLWNAAWINEKVPAMVWNPPLFFILYAPIFYLSSIAPLIITIASLVCVVFIMRISWRLVVSHVDFPARYILLMPLLSLPFLFTLQLGQVTAILTLFLILVLYFYKQKKDIIAGIFLGLLVVKPHLFYLTIVAISCVAILERRFLIFVSASCIIVLLCLIAEILSPGIHSDWINRDVWPISYMGSAFSSLLRAISRKFFSFDLPYLALAVTIFAILFICFGIYKKGRIWGYKIIPFTILVAPIFAPYGFIFDQLASFIPILWLLSGSQNNKCSLKENHIILLYGTAFVLTILVGAFLPYLRIANLPIWWFLPSIFNLIIWCYAEPRLNSSIVFQESFQ